MQERQKKYWTAVMRSSIISARTLPRTRALDGASAPRSGYEEVLGRAEMHDEYVQHAIEDFTLLSSCWNCLNVRKSHTHYSSSYH
eukprot:7182419-Pyramimonas_sp.AAC.1